MCWFCHMEAQVIKVTNSNDTGRTVWICRLIVPWILLILASKGMSRDISETHAHA